VTDGEAQSNAAIASEMPDVAAADVDADGEAAPELLAAQLLWLVEVHERPR
jgi:hypothetical protein